MNGMDKRFPTSKFDGEFDSLVPAPIKGVL